MNCVTKAFCIPVFMFYHFLKIKMCVDCRLINRVKEIS